jgi:hypothetical protein
MSRVLFLLWHHWLHINVNWKFLKISYLLEMDPNSLLEVPKPINAQNLLSKAPHSPYIGLDKTRVTISCRSIFGYPLHRRTASSQSLRRRKCGEGENPKGLGFAVPVFGSLDYMSGRKLTCSQVILCRRSPNHRLLIAYRLICFEILEDGRFDTNRPKSWVFVQSVVFFHS